MSAPPLSLKPKPGSSAANTTRPATANWPADMIPAMTTCEPENAPDLAGRRQLLAEQERSGHHVDEQGRQRVPDRERLGGKDAVRVRESPDTLGAERECQESTDDSGRHEQGAKVSRPLANDRCCEKDERKQNDRFPDIICGPHPASPETKRNDFPDAWRYVVGAAA